MARVAMCYDHDEPLVLTMVVPKHEFICMKCGRLYDYISPRPAPETPELMKLSDEREEEWNKLTEGIIIRGSWLESCDKCVMGDPAHYHSTHATDEEAAANAAARRRLIERFPSLEAWM